MNHVRFANDRVLIVMLDIYLSLHVIDLSIESRRDWAALLYNFVSR